MTDPVYNVLFLCTGNSARSIMAESLLRKEGAGRFNSFSAGSHPKGEINPYALKTLEAMRLPTDGLRSKGWEEFAAPGAPKMDFVFTVCDNAAGEQCPVWPGQPMTAHWGIEDPAAVEGTDIERQRAFNAALRYLRNRIIAFSSLPLQSISALALTSRLKEIGELEGGTRAAPKGGAMDVIIYHNPACGTSRNTLGLIRNAGIEPHVIEYLKTPPTRIMLEQLIARMGMTARALLREKGTPFHELGLDDPALSEDALLDAMLAHPILINRPIVVTPNGVRLCRPSERVLDLLPPQRGAFSKEDGERVIDEHGRRVKTA